MSLKRKIKLPTTSSSDFSIHSPLDEASRSSDTNDSASLNSPYGRSSMPYAESPQPPTKTPRIVLKLPSQKGPKILLPSPSPAAPDPVTQPAPLKKLKITMRKSSTTEFLAHTEDSTMHSFKSETETIASDSTFQTEPASRPSLPQSFSTHQTPQNSQLPSSPPKPKQPQSTPFQDLLHYYLSYLERKDVDRFFAFPITDLVAPNYSAIVKQPMDFSTVRKKISRSAYRNLPEFKHDLDLIWKNAMTYNDPTTIYFKAAKMMSKIAKKALSKDRLRYAKPHVPALDSVPADLLSFDSRPPSPAKQHHAKTEKHHKSREIQPEAPLPPLEQPRTPPRPSRKPSKEEKRIENKHEIESVRVSTERIVHEERPLQVKPEPVAEIVAVPPVSEQSIQVSAITIGSMNGPYEKIPEEDAQEVLENWKKLGQEAADKLATRNVKVVIPARMPDGTVALNLVNPDQKITMSVGALAGPLKAGVDRLPTFCTGPRMDAASVYEKYYKDYGSFASAAPVYDSSGSVFTKEEVDLLRSAYGSEKGVIHAESLIRWGKDVKHPFVKKSLERFLNDASGGEHSEIVHMLNERIVQRAEAEKAAIAKEAARTVPADLVPLADGDQVHVEMIQQLKSLADEGIDVSFLDVIPPEVLKQNVSTKTISEPDSLLALNGEILHQLYLEQTKRLATTQTKNLGKTSVPSETEMLLAEESVKNLSMLMKTVKPEDVVSSYGIRRALNVA